MPSCHWWILHSSWLCDQTSSTAGRCADLGRSKMPSLLHVGCSLPSEHSGERHRQHLIGGANFEEELAEFPGQVLVGNEKVRRGPPSVATVTCVDRRTPSAPASFGPGSRQRMTMSTRQRT